MMIAVAVKDSSGVSAARSEASGMAARSGFVESDSGRVALVATELATNLVKHGGGGEILVGSYEDNVSRGIEVLALDRGPGMANVQACLVDGYSSAGTRGNGLGAIQRQSHFVDIASWPGLGTAVLARLEPGAPTPNAKRPQSQWGAVSIAMPGQAVCGDSWAVTNAGEMWTFLIADGLGHGNEAADASVEAVRLFHRFNGHQVATLLDYIHGGLRSSRGAAISIARFDPATRRVVFGGIGNVAGLLSNNEDLKRMVSMPGTAGHNARKIQAFEYPFERGLVILASDGLSTNWSPARYPNLNAAHPSLIAAILYRDFSRGRDDATVLVGKWIN